MAYTIEECINEDCNGLTITGNECEDCIDPPVVARDPGIQRARAFRAGVFDNEFAGV